VPAASQQTPRGHLSGRVLAADTGRPLKRARVQATAPELPRGRATLTDDGGAFELSDLPAGRYTVTASKAGFISLSYGQRRPLQTGTPLQLADGQNLKGVDFSLPRGGAIAGRIADEEGEPMPGITVRVLREQYDQGRRRLVPAGTGQTDDRGQYRVWGLMPGTYYVSATAREFGMGGARGGSPPGGRFGAPTDASPTDSPDSVAYAPTYFPGIGSVEDATPIVLGISQELLDVSFGLQLVRTVRVSGQVTGPSGVPTSTNVLLTPQGTTSARRGPAANSYSGRVRNGSFSIPDVPPGQYTLRARGSDGDGVLYAEQPLTVSGVELSVSVVLVPGGAVSGTIAFEAGQTPPSDVTVFHVGAPAADPGPVVAAPSARVDATRQFNLSGLEPGLHYIRSNSAQGWTLKSVLVNGQDVIDVPIDVRSGQTVANATLVYTDKATDVSGSVATDAGIPATEYTVLAFPVNDTLWRPQSRHIMTARPDQNGRFQIHGLPAGEYYLALADPAEPGEWFDPSFLQQERARAVKISLADGDAKTQDFKIPAR
jgi:hypothetical protein